VAAASGGLSRWVQRRRLRVGTPNSRRYGLPHVCGHGAHRVRVGEQDTVVQPDTLTADQLGVRAAGGLTFDVLAPCGAPAPSFGPVDRREPDEGGDTASDEFIDQRTAVADADDAEHGHVVAVEVAALVA